LSPRSPTLAETLREVLEHRLTSLHVCLPGRVESYDPVTQTASIKLTIKSIIRYADSTGEDELDYPVLQLVPVAHPRAGAWRIHLPLSAGDFVMVHFAERSLEQWRALGDVQSPLDLRKHDLSDAIAVPCNLYPDAEALVGLTANKLSIGKQGGSVININDDGTIAVGSDVPTDAVATANKVNAQLQALASVFTTWVPVPNDGGAALKLLLTTLLATWPADVSSTKVKVDP
jgi:Phage protein Gp138 N-terminal domain